MKKLICISLLIIVLLGCNNNHSTYEDTSNSQIEKSQTEDYVIDNTPIDNSVTDENLIDNTPK